MENYDPEFSKIFRTGDILIGGYNFGCGSSREQAATAFLSCGMNVILAGGLLAKHTSAMRSITAYYA